MTEEQKKELDILAEEGYRIYANYDKKGYFKKKTKRQMFVAGFVTGILTKVKEN